MPFASMTAAVSEISAMFATDWAALTPALNGDVAIPLLWEGDQQDDPPPSAGPWARVAIRHDDAEQVSFGAQGARRYTRYGRIIAEINCPLRMGVQLAESMAIIARDAYEGRDSPNGAWFRRVHVKTIGPIV